MALSQYLPGFTGFPAAPPFPFGHALSPRAANPNPLENLAGSKALSALASAQKRLADFDDTLQQQSKRRRLADNDPLDLSPGSKIVNDEDDNVDILSIDPPSPSNVEQWSVDRVVDFVSNVESCSEFAEVNIQGFSI